MTGDQAVADLGAEREIDLRSWWHALRSRWWIAGIGLLIGIVIGALYSLSGGSSYTATALIAPGQIFNPNGSTPVLTYLTNQAAITTLLNQTAVVDAVAAKAHMSPGQLRGHISVSSFNDLLASSGSSSNSGSNRILGITVTSMKPKHAEDAANALAKAYKASTPVYVTESISAYQTLIKNFRSREATLNAKIAGLNAVLYGPTGKSLAPLDKLVLQSDLDTAEATLGSTINGLTTTQQQLTLAQSIETTQIITQAKASKTTARSRRNSVLFGALIGLIIGAIVAMVVGLRARRSAAAQPAA
jgi:capsular polysaccharide biosynthesis protein